MDARTAEMMHLLEGVQAARKLKLGNLKASYSALQPAEKGSLATLVFSAALVLFGLGLVAYRKARQGQEEKA